MDEAVIMQRLQRIFKDVFEKPDLEITPELDAASLEEWDSLEHISLLEAIQEEFGCRFSLEERLRLFSVAAIVKAIQDKQ